MANKLGVGKEIDKFVQDHLGMKEYIIWCYNQDGQSLNMICRTLKNCGLDVNRMTISRWLDKNGKITKYEKYEIRKELAKDDPAKFKWDKRSWTKAKEILTWYKVNPKASIEVMSMAFSVPISTMYRILNSDPDDFVNGYKEMKKTIRLGTIGPYSWERLPDELIQACRAKCEQWRKEHYRKRIEAMEAGREYPEMIWDKIDRGEYINYR